MPLKTSRKTTTYLPQTTSGFQRHLSVRTFTNVVICLLTRTILVSFVDETPIVSAEYCHHHMLSNEGSYSGSPLHPTPLSPVSSATDQPFPGLTQVSSSYSTVLPQGRVDDESTWNSFSIRDAPWSPSRPNLGETGRSPKTTSPPGYLHLTSPHQSLTLAPVRSRDRINATDQPDGLAVVSSEMLCSPEALHRKVGLLLYEDRMLLPFKVPQEALLFHHYMEALAAFVSVPSVW